MLEVKGTIKKYKSGEYIFKEGDEGREMYIIRSGEIKIFREREGRIVVLTTLRAPEFFGEMALLENKPRSASAQAIEDSELEVIDLNTFTSFINAPLVWTILKKMGERIREVDDKLEELSLRDQVRKEHLSSLLTQKRWFV